MYFGGSTLEADKVTYDETAKRLHAEGNVRLTEADGRVTLGEIMNLSDDFRDGFVDSLRLDSPDATRMAASRADRSSGNFTVFHSGVYTACEACKDDPKKPPLWQIKSARMIHDEGEKMIYFENAQLEFFGKPVAYMPYFSAPDPTVKRKTGYLIPMASYSTKYGAGMDIPYYWALAPDYDLTFSPRVMSKQGVLLRGEWRQRLVNGAYSIRASGIYQLDKDYFLREGGPATPGYRDWRGAIRCAPA
jgi:LPS-assembly protein